MDDQNFKDLAQRAFQLYTLTQELEKTMLEMFLHEFLDLEEQQHIHSMQDTELPF